MLLHKIPPWVKNKYFLASMVFLAWITFFDNKHGLITVIQNSIKLKEREAEKERYLQEIEETDRALEQLSSDPKMLEKFAREKYKMKRENEDVFLIVKD